MPKIRVFEYVPDLDAFEVTEQYKKIADTIGISEWNPVVWIGRLFSMDNDSGEHWFDNWDRREAIGPMAGKFGRDAFNLLIIDPDRFQDGRDGPCNTPEFRKRFWTDVLISLELDPNLLFDKAREVNSVAAAYIKEHPLAPRDHSNFIPDLEQRIADITGILEMENRC